MRQVVQHMGAGTVSVVAVPPPSLADRNFVLVRTHYSVISAGTEKTKIDVGRKSLLGKALARPDQVRKVIEKFRRDGLAATVQTVRARLDAFSCLGYSSVGEVLAVGDLVEGLQPGDMVACAGAGYANHADVVALPKTLVAKVPAAVPLEWAALTTLGAIALQGVRLADPKIGETVLVIGLGLLGQIAVRLLHANGCRVIGHDIDPRMMSVAPSFVHTFPPGGSVTARCQELTGGHGVDAVLICAGTSSNEPIELAGEACRDKGRVVVVGAVGMTIPREPYFKKEINLVVSRSYGPGRYDPDYEERGQDYPYGYVRFTEKRNMETFLGLIAEKKIDIAPLITHRFPLDAAAAAYALLDGQREEPYLAILLDYDVAASVPASRESPPTASSPDILGIALIGAGNYATATLLPVLAAHRDLRFDTVISARGLTAKRVAERYGFRRCGEALPDALGDGVDLVVIATRHGSHAALVTAALQAGKHVFVEKPLSLSMTGLRQIDAAAGHGGQLAVGFNRRFAPLGQWLRQQFAGIAAPKTVSIRVNAGPLPGDHWINDPLEGGGRLLGEGCHFIDLASHLVGAPPVSVYARAAALPEKSALLNDQVVIVLGFADGSLATIAYSGDGPEGLGKERIEMIGGGLAGVIEDFHTGLLYRGGRCVDRRKIGKADKGQKAMVEAVLAGLRSGRPAFDYDSLMLSSIASLSCVESLVTGDPQTVSLSCLHSQ